MKKIQFLVRFELRTLAIPGVFVTSRLSVENTQRNLKLLLTCEASNLQKFVLSKNLQKFVLSEKNCKNPNYQEQNYLTIEILQ